MPEPLRRVALTGGIATGKSYVLRRLGDAGVPTCDADVLARRVVEPGTPALKAIGRRFGPDVIQPDGMLDRRRLADIVFQDPAARRDLEAITHPAIRAAIETFFDDVSAATPFAVADIPLLYETGRESEFSRVIVAACPRAMQVARVMARDGASREEAERRLAAQLPIEDKVKRADYVIWTTGTYAETDAQLASVVEKLESQPGCSRDT
ncbi:MAG: dephospho-CoA kinase [Vicinamibacterales bacterium]